MNIDKVFHSAMDHYNQGDMAQAEALCKKLLAKKPKHADTLNLTGMIRYERKDYDGAIDYIRKAVQLNPANSYFHNNLGTAYKARKDLDASIAAYRRALQINPNFADAYNNLGSVLQGKRLLDEAVECYEKALHLSPNSADAYFNLGTALRAKGQFDEAIASYQKALDLNPGFVEAYNNLGADFKERGKLREALGYFEKVLELRPEFVEAYNNIGSILSDQGRLAEAEEYYRQALHLNPDFPVCHSNLLLSMNYSGQHDAGTVYQEHLRFAGRFAAPASGILPHANARIPDRRIRIGYVSPDFRRHSVYYFIEPVLASHDRERFEIFCYSDVVTPDEVTGRIQSYPLHWHDTVGKTDEQVSSFVRSDGIDILVDLAGHTAYNRMLLFARKPAPVQVTWLGYPNTTGLPTMDYRIVDTITDPPGMTDPFHTEELVRMPETFLCYHPEEESPEVGPLPCLETGHVTFGSFNLISKISPAAVAMWARILQRVPNSTMLLKAKSLFDQGTRQYLGDLFQQQGIPGERLEFMFHTASYREHLDVYNRIDIGLDTLPYHGTTTTCEAVWMGVPVVTRAGDRHASRVGASLLTSLGLPELIADTDDAYVDLAVHLASDTGRLRLLRAELRSMLSRSPLTNADRFTRNLEACYQRMWQKWCTAGKP